MKEKTLENNVNGGGGQKSSLASFSKTKYIGLCFAYVKYVCES